MTLEAEAPAAVNRYRRSRQLFEEAQNYLPGGNSRLTVYHQPHPIYLQEGRGCHLIDVDGNHYLDFINNYTSLIHGHIHPEIEKVVVEALRRGTAFAGTTEVEVRLAQLLTERLPAVDQVRFTNSGSEAVMIAIKAARAYTGKPAIAKFEGAYHGSYDFAEVSQAASPSTWGEFANPVSVAYSKGTPEGVLNDVVVMPFNHIDETVALLRKHKDHLAAVLIDIMPSRLGLIAASPEFLQALQAECRTLGILIILDEVINLRLDYHGAQSVFGVDPDLTTMAKIIGGGFPIGAVGGKREVMAVFDPSGGKKPALPHGGTFNANPMSMTAGLKAMELMTPEEFDRLNGLGEKVRQSLREIIERLGVDWQVTGQGSLFQLHAKTTPLTDYRSSLPSTVQAGKLAALHRGLLDRGIFLGLPAFGCVSTAMTDNEVAILAEKVEDTLREIEGLN
jgi:glutamate-1-semialdehyde 2,1-aminomutase